MTHPQLPRLALSAPAVATGALPRRMRAARVARVQAECIDDALNALEHAIAPDLDGQDCDDLQAAARLIRRTLRRMQDRHQDLEARVTEVLDAAGGGGAP